MNLKQYMMKTGVTKKAYVDLWIDNDLIPGASRIDGVYTFPDSSRRPYRDSHLKPGLPAEKIRAHIIKAALLRQHISASTCFMSNGEFAAMISDLDNAGLLSVRIEDGITYYDSKQKSKASENQSLRAIGKFVQECLAITANNVAEGATKAVIDKLITPRL